MDVKECKINEFLTVKLEGGKIFMYVGNERISKYKFPELEFPNAEGMMKPEIQFLRHCSTLQVWNESGYDTKFLNSHSSLRLLRELSHAGDPIAKRKIKEEIVHHLETDHSTMISVIMKERLLFCLEENDQQLLITQYFPKLVKIMKNAPYWINAMLFFIIFRGSAGTRLLEDNFLIFLDFVDELRDVSPCICLLQLILNAPREVVEEYQHLIEPKFVSLLKKFDKIPKDDKLLGFNSLVRIAEWIEVSRNYKAAFMKMIITHFKEKREDVLNEMVKAIRNIRFERG